MFVQNVWLCMASLKVLLPEAFALEGAQETHPERLWLHKLMGESANRMCPHHFLPECRAAPKAAHS